MEKQLKATVEAEGVDVGDVGVSEGLQQAMVNNASAIFTKYPLIRLRQLIQEGTGGIL